MYRYRMFMQMVQNYRGIRLRMMEANLSKDMWLRKWTKPLVDGYQQVKLTDQQHLWLLMVFNLDININSEYALSIDRANRSHFQRNKL
jgi:hypothetical protein